VAKATGLSRTTILSGIRELKLRESSQELPSPKEPRQNNLPDWC